MRRGRPAKHTNHPLFRLRALLGEAAPITQPELARIVHVPLATLQSIETGRRGRLGLPHSISERITAMIGARWDDERKFWVTGPIYFEKLEPFTRQHFDSYRRILTSEPSKWFQEHAPAGIKKLIDKLFEHVPKGSWVNLCFRLFDVLEQVRQDFAPTDKELKKASDEIVFSVAAFAFRDSSVPHSEKAPRRRG